MSSLPGGQHLQRLPWSPVVPCSLKGLASGLWGLHLRHGGAWVRYVWFLHPVLLAVMLAASPSAVAWHRAEGAAKVRGQT